MARVLALTRDLLFGSQIQGALLAAGEQIQIVGEAQAVRAALEEHPDTAALVVDLTDDGLDGSAILEALSAEGALAGLATLAYYSHVEADVRARALEAGFDLVVARSRMAREAPQLVRGLLADSRTA
jgi:DNA-binding NarL/FixJ family response regulator